MTIIARIRPSVEVKPTRVSKPRPAAFGAGLVDEVQDAVDTGRASRLPQPNGRGLTPAEYAVINGEVNEARYEVGVWAWGLPQAECAAVVSQAVRAARLNAFRAVLDARPRLHPVATAKPAPTMARGFVTRDQVYVPHDQELAAYYAILGRDEALSLDRELEEMYAESVAYERMMSGTFSDADMALVGAVG